MQRFRFDHSLSPRGYVVRMPKRIDFDPPCEAMVDKIGWTEPLCSERDALGICSQACCAKNVVACDARLLARVREYQRKGEWVRQRTKSL
jgi:hypothetical protein